MKRLTLSSLVIGIVVLAAVGLSQRSSDIRYINLPGHAILYDAGNNAYRGASESRKDGMAAGY